jgi:hypothetical protein
MDVEPKVKLVRAACFFIRGIAMPPRVVLTHALA